MKQRPPSHKRNSKSLLSTTIEQIKKDLKEEYNETPKRNNINNKRKKINKRKFAYTRQESEKTNNENDENINYNNISKYKNKKLLNISTNNCKYKEKNIEQNKFMNYYQLSSEKNNNYLKSENENVLQIQIKDFKIKSQNMKDKLTIFLKLMKKYSFKLTTLAKNSSRNNNSKEKNNVINIEIKSTLSQLNRMLNNQKLN